MKVAGRIVSVELRKRDKAVILRLVPGGAFTGLIIHFVSSSVVRVRAVAAPVSVDDAQERSYILKRTTWDDELDGYMERQPSLWRQEVNLPKIRKSGDVIEISSAHLTIRCNQSDPCVSLQLLDSKGHVLMSDQQGRSYAVDANGRMHHVTDLHEDDAFFGGGESCGPVNKRGHLIQFSPRDAIGHDPEIGGPMYKHIPFWIKSNRSWAGKRALGVFYNTTWDAEASLGREISGYFPRFCRFTQNGGDVDVVYTYGEKSESQSSIEAVVTSFAAVVGYPVLLPKYAFGYLGSTMYLAELRQGADDAHIKFVERCAALGIPMDGWHLSSGYTAKEKSGKRCVFYWNKDRWSNPGAWFERMKRMGVIVSPNIKPGMLVGEHPLYDKFADSNAFITSGESSSSEPYVGQWWGGNGSFVDFTNPVARKLWKEAMVEALIMKGGEQGGTPSIWNDNNEYDSCVIGAGQAIANFDGKPASMEQLRVVMPTLMARCSFEAVRKERPSERPYIICRSGCTGIQRYAQVWGGDNTTSWKTLKWNVAQILSAGLSGLVHYGCDIGGFHGPRPSAELLVRWIQQGIFQPRFSIHSANNDNTVTLPWMYGEPYTSIIRDAIKLRYAFVPYLYSLAYQARTRGSLLLRPLLYDFDSDVECYDNNTDTMLGPYLLVANVLEEGAVSRRVYLPSGTHWYDFYTRERTSGGTWVDVPVTLETWPMYIRGSGAIIPMTDDITRSIALDTISTVKFIVACGEAEFTMYDDDGAEESACNQLITKMRMCTQGDCVSLEVSSRHRHSNSTLGPSSMQFEFLSEKGALHVILDAETKSPQKLQQFVNADELENMRETAGWVYDPRCRCVRVNIPDVKALACCFKIKVSFADFDLIGMVEDE